MMILIGQYDSPFTRRVAIAMALYGLEFEHKPWSTFSDAKKIREYNPLLRVPTLVVDDGDVLVESSAILDYVDSQFPEERRLFPVSQPERRRAMRVAGIATGISDKAVSLFYEKVLHEQPSPLWVERCRIQIVDSLALLERDRMGRGDTWFGSIGHADIAVATTLRHLNEAHPKLVSMADYPALQAHSERLENLPVLQEISQPFIAPA